MKRIYTIVALCAMAMMPIFASSFKVLTIDPAGGNNTMIAQHLIYDEGASLIVTPPTRAGYTFAGWTGTGVPYLSHTLAAGSGETTFNGTSTYYNLGTDKKYTDKITINIWAYMDNWAEYATGDMRLISCTQTGGWGINKDSNNKVRWECYDATAAGYKRVSSVLWSSLAAGWHMFTMSFDGRNYYTYIDGVLQGSSAIFEGKIGYNVTNSILLGAEAGTGATPAGNYFKGKMKDVSITNAFMNAEGVKAMYDYALVQHGDNLKTMRFFMPTANKKLTATWTANPATTLTLNANGGVNTMAQNSYSQAAGTALTVTNPMLSGATFTGWSTATSQYISNNQGFACSSPKEVTFNGTSTYYNIGTAYKYADAITVNIWAYMDKWAEYNTADMRMISCTQAGGWGLESNGEKIRFAIRDGGKDAYRSVTLSKKWSELKAGWHMFTITFDGSRAMCYIDGQLLGKSSVFNGNIGYHASNSILIGAEAGVDASAAGNYFKGKIKNVSIMHTAIPAEEVAYLYANPGIARAYFPSTNHTQVATWQTNPATTLNIDVNGGVNTMAQNSYSQAVGTGLTITAPTRSKYEFVNWDKTTSQNVSNYQGLPASSPTEVSFNGTSTYYSLGRDYMYTDVLSFNVWAYMDNWAEYGAQNLRIISCTEKGGFNLESSDGNISFSGYDSGVGYKAAVASQAWSSLSTGWHMFTYVFDGTCIRGYIDGKIVVTGPIFDSGLLGYNATNSILLGAESGSGNIPASTPRYFKGKLKNFAIMHTALAPDEVAQLYATPGLTRYYFASNNTTLKAIWKESTNVPTPTISVNANEATIHTTVGTPVEHTFTVVGTDLTGTMSVQLSGTHANLFSVSASTLSATGGPLTVRYTPSALGTHHATITLSATGATSQTITLTGEVIEPTITVSAQELTWNTVVGLSADQSLTITGINITGAMQCTLSGTHADLFTLSTTAIEGTNSTLTISYEPIEAGTHSATLTITAEGATAQSVTLTATAQAPVPVIAIDASELTFSTPIQTSATQTCTIEAANLTGDISATISGMDASLFSLSTSTLTSEGGTITVTYTPLTSGLHKAQLVLSATGATTQTITLSGTATDHLPTIYVDKSHLNFTSIINSSAQSSITVSGDYVQSDIQLTLSGDQASYFSLSASTLGAEGGTVDITYSAATEGTHTAILTVTATNSTPHTINLVGLTTTDIELKEQWNFSEVSGKTADWIVTGTQVTQDMAFSNGKLYVVHRNGGNTDNTIYIVDAYKGTKLGQLATATCIGGTYSISSVEVLDGKVVACNLATATEELRVYLWDTDEAEPTVLLATHEHLSVRAGDNFSVSGTLADGKLWFTYEDKAYYYTITDGVCSTSPTPINLTKAGTAFNLGSGSAASGIFVNQDGSLWVSGKDQLTSHFSTTGALEESLPASLLGNHQGTAAQFFTFGNKQYVVATTYLNTTQTSVGNGAFVLANITEGTSAATKLGFYPTNGLGKQTRNTSFRSSLCVDIQEDGVHVWILIPLQGAAYYCYGFVPTLPTSTENDVPTDLRYSITDDILHVSGVEARQLELFSLTGQKVHATSHQNEITVAGLRGIYLVLVKDTFDNIYMTKIVIP